jgi:hypothetical protein
VLAFTFFEAHTARVVGCPTDRQARSECRHFPDSDPASLPNPLAGQEPRDDSRHLKWNSVRAAVPRLQEDLSMSDLSMLNERLVALGRTVENVKGICIAWSARSASGGAGTRFAYRDSVKHFTDHDRDSQFIRIAPQEATDALITSKGIKPARVRTP